MNRIPKDHKDLQIKRDKLMTEIEALEKREAEARGAARTFIKATKANMQAVQKSSIPTDQENLTILRNRIASQLPERIEESMQLETRLKEAKTADEKAEIRRRIEFNNWIMAKWIQLSENRLSYFEDTSDGEGQLIETAAFRGSNDIETVAFTRSQDND